MWIISKDGFLSIVAHDTDPDMLRVRARRLDHLTNAFPSAEVIDHAQTEERYDYRWHANIPRSDFEEYNRRMIEEIDYSSHVKESVSAGDQELYGAMMKMWSILHRLQETPRRPGSHQEAGYDDPSLFDTDLDGPDPRDIEDMESWYDRLERVEGRMRFVQGYTRADGRRVNGYWKKRCSTHTR